jgi:bacterioferritin (cytochrome b1)
MEFPRLSWHTACFCIYRTGYVMPSSNYDVPAAREVDHLNSLLRGELAAVAAYQHALRTVNGGVPDAGQILRFASEHQRTVAALQATVRALGGVPAVESGTWGAFALLRDTASVRGLLSGEQFGLAEYQSALPLLDGDARELLELELIPRQRRHIAKLTEILTTLSS